MKKDMRDHGWNTLREAFQKTSNVTTLTAFTEDTVAISGAGIALFGVFLSRYTGNPLYDAVAALLIGLLLMGFALALAWENKRLLLGESLPKDEERELRDIVDQWDGVANIVDFRTVYFGPDDLLVTADVAFVDDLDTSKIDSRITEMERALMAANEHVVKVYVEPETRWRSRHETAG